MSQQSHHFTNRQLDKYCRRDDLSDDVDKDMIRPTRPHHVLVEDTQRERAEAEGIVRSIMS